MGLYRDEGGLVIDVDDAVAEARGYTPLDPTEREAMNAARGVEARGDERGIVGDINAGLTGVASGLTLGGSDVLLGETLTPLERERLQSELQAHPYLRGAGEVVGAIAPSLVAPESALARTPTGYLSNAVGRTVEEGLTRGGLTGTAKALGAMGAEGAVQSVGQYIGQSAIADKDLTAEGMQGALGTGFAFGVGGGSVALGITKGTIAARRMFSRVADGEQAVTDAASAWTVARQEALDSDLANLQTAQEKLDAISAAKREALRARGEARAAVQEERIRAANAPARGVPDEPGAVDDAFVGPEPLIDVAPQSGAGGVTSKYQAPEPITFDPGDAAAFDAGLPGARDQLADAAANIKKPDTGAKTGAYKATTQRLEVPPEASRASGEPAALPTPVSAEVVRNGAPSARSFEIRTTDSDGGVVSKIVKQDELDAFARSQLPDGYTLGDLNTRTPFKIERTVPTYDAIGDNALYVVKPSDLAERGVFGNEISAEHLASVKAARGDAKKLPPVDIFMTKEGRLYVEDGNHRLQVAAQTDAPVAVRFKQAKGGFVPQASARDISASLRGQAAEATELEGALAGTKAKLDEGVALRDMTPPKANKGNASNSIEEWLREEAAAQRGALDEARATEDLRYARDLRNRRSETLAEIRYKATEELLGPQAAKLERELTEAVEEMRGARADFETLAGAGDTSNGVPEPLDLPFESQPGTAPALKPGARNAAAILDDVHEETLLRARETTDPREAGAALHQAEEIENLLDEITKKHDISNGVPELLEASPFERFSEELRTEIEKVWRQERASAKLSEALGDQAHPVAASRAKALADAERDAERKMFDRSVRAVDDAETFGPTYASPKERVQYARERALDAQRSLDDITAQERDAKASLTDARRKAREGERAKKGALRDDAKAARAAAKASKIGAADAGGLLEIADVPGLPKPSDLPVVGPLLGAYLKYRTLKKALGRAMGRVPATADARAAAMASRTRDRFARAVDRSLGLMEKSARRVIRPAAIGAAVLSQRIYDDGEPDAPKGAPIGELAVVRARELAAYVHTPGAIERDVRLQLRGVTDPDLIQSAEFARRAMMEYILRYAPHVPEAGLLNSVRPQVSPAEAMSWSRRIDAARHPAEVMERLAETHDLVSLEAAQTLREVYPKLFAEAQRRIIARAAEARTVPYRQRVQLTLMYGVPLDPALDPDNLRITQSVYERKVSSPAFNPAAVPPAAPPTATPSIANPVNLSQGLTPALDRSR